MCQLHQPHLVNLGINCQFISQILSFRCFGILDSKGGVDIPLGHQFQCQTLFLPFKIKIPSDIFDLPLAWGQFYSGSNLGT